MFATSSLVAVLLQAATPAGRPAFDPFIPMLLILGLFMYFMIIRPQGKMRKAREQMIKDLKRGDQVVTNGGILGKVVKVADDEITIDTGEGNKIRVMRSMVGALMGVPAPANDTAHTKGK